MNSSEHTGDDNGVGSCLECSCCSQSYPASLFTERQRSQPAEERQCAHCLRAARLRRAECDPQRHIRPLQPRLAPPHHLGQHRRAPSLHAAGTKGHASRPPQMPWTRCLGPTAIASVRPPSSLATPDPCQRRSWSSSAATRVVYSDNLPRHRPPAITLKRSEMEASGRRMHAEAEASKARMERLKAELEASEDALHGPHLVHPPCKGKPNAFTQRRWAREQVKAAEATRQRCTDEEHRVSKAAIEATRPRIPAFSGRDLGKIVMLEGDDVTLHCVKGRTFATENREVRWCDERHHDLRGVIESVQPWVGGRISIEGSEDSFDNPEVARLCGKEACLRNYGIADEYEHRRSSERSKYYPTPPESPKLRGKRLAAFLERNQAAHERQAAQASDTSAKDSDEDSDADEDQKPLSKMRQKMLNARLQAKQREVWKQVDSLNQKTLEAKRAARMEWLGLKPPCSSTI